MFTNERRRFFRFDKEGSFIGWIMDVDMKNEISNQIDLLSINISSSGMLVLWPKRWDCSKCIKCLAWVYNEGCDLKENNLKNANMILEPGLIIKIKPNLYRNKNYSFLSRDLIFAKVIWSFNHGNSLSKFYPVGLSFLQKPLPSVLKKI